jgi:hypothetical protein
MTMMRAVAWSMVLVTAAGCALPTSQQARSVKSADEAMITTCEYLDEVTGWSGWGNLAQDAGMENARNQARERAAELGATHVVWRGLAGGYAPNVVARAYRCPQ